MAIIKTALEIALEKTDNIKGDKSTIDQFEMRQSGKKLANSFLSGEAELAEELKKVSENQKYSLKQGVFDVLIAQIAIVTNKDDLTRLEKVGNGIAILLENSRNKSEFPGMYKQFLQIMGQYLQELSQYDQAIRQQYAPKLRQKEEEISRKIGREVRIDPMQDPEFITFYNQHMTALKGNYEPVISQAKEEAKSAFELTMPGMNTSRSLHSERTMSRRASRSLPSV